MLRQENCEFQTTLGNTVVRTCQKKGGVETELRVGALPSMPMALGFVAELTGHGTFTVMLDSSADV